MGSAVSLTEHRHGRSGAAAGEPPVTALMTRITGRQTDSSDRQTDRQTDLQTDLQTDQSDSDSRAVTDRDRLGPRAGPSLRRARGGGGRGPGPAFSKSDSE
jgi:hypothetical protein